MFEPVKVGFGAFIGRFYAQITPTTRPLFEYVDRGLGKSVAWAPGRMVDAAEEMLSLWQRNDTDSTDTHPHDLPVILIGIDKDYTPTGRDFTRQIADMEYVIFEEDPHERVYGVRTVAGDLRAQIAIIASDEPTARSLASQFLLFLDATGNRWFGADYEFAGFTQRWPVQIETPESPASVVQTENKNLTILTVDITLKATVPLYSAPGDGEPNDGKSDPAGYPAVVEVAHEEATV